MKIGIFDSGVGGLSVLKEIDNYFNGLDIVYVGDTKRLPYGNKDSNTILEYSKEIVSFLLSKNIDIIIIACNTASVNAYQYLKEKYNLPIYSIVDAGIKSIENINRKNILVMATKNTTLTKQYTKQIYAKYKDKYKVSEIACPELVPLIENDGTDLEIEQQIMKYNLSNDKDTCVILGCTHYPFIQKNMKKIYSNIQIINPAKKIVDILKNSIKDNGCGKNKINYYVTKDVDKFKKNIKKFLDKDIENIYLLDLEEMKGR